MGLIDWALLILLMGLFVVNHVLECAVLTSNVPAVMVQMPLALVITMTGNLLIVGSIANLIVVDAARRCGVVIDWWRHARTGVSVVGERWELLPCGWQRVDPAGVGAPQNACSCCVPSWLPRPHPLIPGPPRRWCCVWTVLIWMPTLAPTRAIALRCCAAWWHSPVTTAM